MAETAKPYVHQEYPRMMFHPNGDKRLAEHPAAQEQLTKLGYLTSKAAALGVAESQKPVEPAPATKKGPSIEALTRQLDEATARAEKAEAALVTANSNIANLTKRTKGLEDLLKKAEDRIEKLTPKAARE